MMEESDSLKSWRRLARNTVGKGDMMVHTVNKALDVFIPMLSRALEGMLRFAQENFGGLPLGNPLNPTYKLRLVGQSGPDSYPDKVIEKLSVKLTHVYVTEPKDNVYIPPELSKIPRAELIVADVEVVISLAFNGENVAFQLYGAKWFAPSVGQVGFKDLFVKARARVWWSVHAPKLLFLAFDEDPSVKWDIEIELLAVGIPLPDLIEDEWLAWSVRRVLAHFSFKKPIKIDMNETPAERNKREASKLKKANLSSSELEKEAKKAEIVASIAGQAIDEGLATSAAHFNPATDDVASPTPGLKKI